MASDCVAADFFGASLCLLLSLCYAVLRMFAAIETEAIQKKINFHVVFRIDNEIIAPVRRLRLSVHFSNSVCCVM